MQKRAQGFTLMEILIVIGVLAILALMALPAVHTFENNSDLQTTADEIVATLRLAQNKTVAAKADSAYGVYFDTSVTPNTYTLFKGADYASRDASADAVYQVPSTVDLSSVSFSDSGNEIDFDRVTGNTAQSGSVSLNLSSNPGAVTTVYIESAGTISTTAGTAPSDTARITDSRRVHIAYSRTIDTNTENLVITFPNDGVTKTIPISSYLSGGQIDWSGSIDVNGSTQKLRIHTILLNDVSGGTIFCIHRDRRYNTKEMQIGISGDSAVAPQLIQYAANGTVTQGNSAYVSTPSLQ